MLGEAKGIPHYPCPMCGTPVYSSALQCPSCGTDLTRAGAVFSSPGTSVELRPRRTASVWMAFAAVIALTLAAGTIALPWVQPFLSPGAAVARAASQSVLRWIRETAAEFAQGVARLPETFRGADTSKTSSNSRPSATAGPRSTPAAPARPAGGSSAATGSPARVGALPSSASLTVSSTPRGARVQIDGVARGVTPMTINQLRAGLYRVRISRQGYRPVVRSVRLEPGKSVVLGVSLPSNPPVTMALSAPPPAPVQAQGASLIEVGRPVPQFAAKDRVGVIYRATDYRGRKLILVFVQSLDGNAQRIIRELNALRTGGARGAAVVVVLRPNRASIRQFTQAEQIQIPVLFGTQTVARAYGVSSQPAVLYLVSEEGRVVVRQTGRLNPGAVLN